MREFAVAVFLLALVVLLVGLSLFPELALPEVRAGHREFSLSGAIAFIGAWGGAATAVAALGLLIRIADTVSALRRRLEVSIPSNEPDMPRRSLYPPEVTAAAAAAARKRGEAVIGGLGVSARDSHAG